MNNYEAIVDLIQLRLENAGVKNNIVLGNTDSIDWKPYVKDSDTTYGVLNVSGGSNIRIKDATQQIQYLTIALAIPNNAPQQYSTILDVFNGVIQDITSGGTIELENTENVYLVDNGMTSTDFRVINGKQIGILSQQIQMITAVGLMEADGTIITINNTELKGWYQHTINKTKIFDPANVQSQNLQQNDFRGLQYALVIDFNKISNEALHKAFLSDTDTFTVTVNDGEDNIINNLPMHLASYTQNGISGGYINCQVKFISGVDNS